MNSITQEDLVSVIKLDSEEYLKYDAPKIDIGIIRGTTADGLGNITLKRNLRNRRTRYSNGNKGKWGKSNLSS